MLAVGGRRMRPPNSKPPQRAEVAGSGIIGDEHIATSWRLQCAYYKSCGAQDTHATQPPLA